MKLLMSAVCALGLAVAISGCATSEEEFIIQNGITDERVELTGNSDFGLKNLEVFSKTDDNGLLTVDVTVEISRTTFWFWVFNGDPLLKLAYRFDWIDNQGKIDSMPWQYSSALPGNILRFHGIAPAEKYTAFKLFVQFCEEGKVLPDPSAAKTEAAPMKEAEGAAANAAESEKAVAPASVAEKKAEVTPVKTDVKKADADIKAEVKKVEAEAKADVKKVEAKAASDVKKADADIKADVKKVEAKAASDVKKADADIKADVKKVEAKAASDVKKVEAEAKADVKKVEAKVEADVKKIEKELKKEEGKLTESFY